MNRSESLYLNLVPAGIPETELNGFTVPLYFTHIFFFSIRSIVTGPSHLLDFSLYTRTGSPISSLYLVAGGSLEAKASEFCSPHGCCSSTIVLLLVRSFDRFGMDFPACHWTRGGMPNTRSHGERPDDPAVS